MYLKIVILVLKIKTAQQGQLTARGNFFKENRIVVCFLSETILSQNLSTKLEPIGGFMNEVPVEVMFQFSFPDFEHYL